MFHIKLKKLNYFYSADVCKSYTLDEAKKIRDKCMGVVKQHDDKSISSTDSSFSTLIIILTTLLIIIFVTLNISVNFVRLCCGIQILLDLHRDN